MPPMTFEISDCCFFGAPSRLKSLTCSERYRMNAFRGRARCPSRARFWIRLSALEIPGDSDEWGDSDEVDELRNRGKGTEEVASRGGAVEVEEDAQPLAARGGEAGYGPGTWLVWMLVEGREE